MASPKTRRVVLGVAAGAVLAALGVALAVFEPWQLFVDDVVDEAIPEAVARSEPTSTTGASPAAPTQAPATAPTPAPTQPRPVLLARGAFISHEHATTGTAEVIQLPDGHRILALRGLHTSNGPDLHVWLAEAPVIDGRDGWHVFDDGAHLTLGPLKGNIGDQTYDIPADADLSRLTSVSIWCDRFNVSFGAVALAGV
ncbi:MAG: DM13 domain-containing protein [Acidimicrobiales bacterium]